MQTQFTAAIEDRQKRSKEIAQALGRLIEIDQEKTRLKGMIERLDDEEKCIADTFKVGDDEEFIYFDQKSSVHYLVKIWPEEGIVLSIRRVSFHSLP